LKNQKGSAHVVIIVILTLLVLGLLGFVFWQNFLAPKNGDDSSVTTGQAANETIEEELDPLTEVKTISYSGATFAFQHPKSWTVNETSSTSGRVSSSDQSVYYDYSLLGLGGVGGTCGDDEKVTSVYWGSTSINDNIIFGQYSVKSSGDGGTFYSYGFGLMLDEQRSFRNMAIGDAGCSMDLRSILHTGINNTDNEPVVATFTGHFKYLDDVTPTQEDINAAFGTKTFELAKRIALSATLKP